MFRSLFIKVLYTILMFLATILLGNIAHPEHYGAISLLILNAALFSLVTGLGADTMIMHMVGNNKWSIDEAIYFMWRTIVLQLSLFVVLELGCMFFFKISLLSTQPGFHYFFIDLLYFLGVVLVEKFIALFYSVHKATIANIALVVVASAYFLLLSVYYFFLHTNFSIILYSFAIQSLLQGVVLLIIFFSNHNLKGSPIKDKKITFFFRASSIVMITNIIQLLAYRIDFWILKANYSNYEVGIYSQANKFANLVWLVPNVTAQLLVPKYIMIEKTDLLKVFRSSFVTNLLIVIATIVFANVFYWWVLNPEYRQGLKAFYLMIPGYFFSAAVIYFSSYFSWKGDFKYNLWGSIGCFLVILIADLLLIPKLSYNGAAIANSIAYTSIFGYYIFRMTRVNFKMSDLFMLRPNDIQKAIMILK
jgi:O-antigen/teichoic acid export membrane protein